MKRPTAAEAFADNVQRLMDRDGLSQAELGRQAGVAQTMLSGLLKKSLKPKNPKFETLAKLASHFKVAPWMLLMPGIPLDLLAGDDLARLLEGYTVSSRKVREMIVHLVEQEVKVAALPPPEPNPAAQQRRAG